MTIYRTGGPWGPGKGANLTPGEVDANFYDLVQRVEALEDNPPSPVQISNITVVGSQLTVHMSNGATFGPFTMPRVLMEAAPVQTIAAATYTPVLADGLTYNRCTHAGGCIVTIPSDADVDFLIGTEIHWRQAGVGPISFMTGTGVTLDGIEGFVNGTDKKGAAITTKKVAANTWDLLGLLAESA